MACEAVVQAETKDHLNWELLHEASEKAKGDEHLFHSSGWCRELWIESPPSPASTWTPTRAWSRSTAPCRPRP